MLPEQWTPSGLNLTGLEYQDTAENLASSSPHSALLFAPSPNEVMLSSLAL